MIRPVSSEKAVKLIDLENTIVFEVARRSSKEDIKKEVSSLLGVKVDSLRTLIRNNKKYAYVRFDKSVQAADVASKMGMM
ncbi:MAG: 50S ribosomal protein L23 [Nanoarchaeota archaeon]